MERGLNGWDRLERIFKRNRKTFMSLILTGLKTNFNYVRISGYQSIMSASKMKLQISEKIQHLFSDQLLKKLVDLRHDLHRYPELSFQEKRTAEKLHEALSSLNPVHVERVAGTGIIARIKGRSLLPPSMRALCTPVDTMCMRPGP
jgi:hypothetical protein